MCEIVNSDDVGQFRHSSVVVVIPVPSTNLGLYQYDHDQAASVMLSPSTLMGLWS